MKYKQLAEEREKQLGAYLEEINMLKTQIATYEAQFAEHAAQMMESEEAREVLRLFAAKAGNRDELVLLVRALAKLPA